MSVQDEAQNTTPKDLEFELHGEKYTIPGDVMNDLEFVEMLEDENYTIACRRALGKVQWHKFKESVRQPNGRVETQSLSELMDAIMGAADPTSASDA